MGNINFKSSTNRAPRQNTPGEPGEQRELQLKLQVIRIYNSKLDDRERRKRFVIDRGLVDRKEQVAQDRRRSKEERDIVARLRVFARFHSAADHEALVRQNTPTPSHTLPLIRIIQFTAFLCVAGGRGAPCAQAPAADRHLPAVP